MGIVALPMRHFKENSATIPFINNLLHFLYLHNHTDTGIPISVEKNEIIKWITNGF